MPAEQSTIQLDQILHARHQSFERNNTELSYPANRGISWYSKALPKYDQMSLKDLLEQAKKEGRQANVLDIGFRLPAKCRSEIYGGTFKSRL